MFRNIRGFFMRHLLSCAVVAAVVCLAAGSAAAQIDFGTLLSELTDRDRLAVYPNSGAAYKTYQASSYQPTPTTLGAPANFSNIDASNFHGREMIDGHWEYVMLSDTGPGAISRWWMTNTLDATGEIRVYIDGSATPVMNGPIQPLLAQNGGFGPRLSFRSRANAEAGNNLYAPIPYSKSVKITYRGPINTAASPYVFYNIDYRKYEPAAVVQTYSANTPTTCAKQINAANAALAAPAVTGSVTKKHSQEVTLAAGQDVAYDLTGAGAIRRLQLKVTGTNQVETLRNTYVELTFDGEKTTRVPVGQFFGNGDGSAEQPYNTFDDFYRTVAADGTMTSRWVMPYQNTAKVRLVNLGDKNVDAAITVDSGSWTWDANSMHFHANYREETNIKTRAANGTADFRYLTVRGQGVYVGDTLSLRNGSGGWWGEGDEKVYVDYINAQGIGGNATPTHAGTGSEDYYGYAWCHAETFDSPFVSQPISAANNTPNGRSVNSRVRALDAIPFDKSFKFDMEMWHWNETKVDYGATTYWYGSPGASAMRVAADLAGDYKAGHDFTTGRLTDTAGDGHWTYLSSSKANASSSDAEVTTLSCGTVGNAGNQGYGGGQNGHNLATISDEYIFVDGGDNIGVQGGPGYHELAIHPAGNGADLFAGNAEQPYAVARWTAGASSAGTANISGSVRNLINGGNGIDFYIYVNGVLGFSAAAHGATLPETYFDFDVTLRKGSVIDFVVGNNGNGNLGGDESLLRATILILDSATTVPEPCACVLSMQTLIGSAVFAWRRKQGRLTIQWFCSAHAGGCHSVFCDGSDHTIGYSIDPPVHKYQGSRDDGNPVDGKPCVRAGSRDRVQTAYYRPEFGQQRCELAGKHGRYLAEHLAIDQANVDPVA